MSYGEVPLPKPRKSPKGNTESDGQAAHDITVRFEKRGRSATHAAEPQEACALLHPLQGASFLSTPLQGGILKPPALRVVVDCPKIGSGVRFAVLEMFLDGTNRSTARLHSTISTIATFFFPS